MPQPVTILQLIGGLAILAIAGDFLVGGAVTVARRSGLSPLLAGIFIVGFGTSAPEMIVALNAAMSGYPDLALGNIVGSNIANIWLVLALPALIAPIATGGFGQKRALTVMLIATFMWIGVTASLPLDPRMGIFFLVALAGYVLYTFATARAGARIGLGMPAEVERGVEVEARPMSLQRASVYVIIGIIGLPVGAHLIVEGGVDLARSFHISEEIIGLTLLAIGTSLPEIGAGIAAALRGKGDILVGNILGSNIFNILAAGGIISFFGPINVASTFPHYDHWAMAAAALTVAVFIIPKAKISRLAAITMLLIYALYLYGLVDGWNILALFG